MSAQNLYSIVDIKAEVGSPPFVAQNHGVASRMFADLVNGGGEALPAKYPADFKLVHVGFWDAELCKVVAVDELLTIGFGSDFKEKPSLKAVQNG